ncbi:hypothetical protein yc1106_01394 [Curvularia clavata]|uniref:Xylanolytic transcriptional activator regulatory domain-containing protein n=1 Tax=Curvularia clavata TaxID=95742 RepID=A0A9Q8Z2T2_CURCL|nr:hypothetical protein yc1106_01394 [Curvularia clavata]
MENEITRQDVPRLLRNFHFCYVGAFIVIFLIARLVYSISLHPLRKIPGPFAAKLTELWRTWKLSQGNWHIDILELHRKYGPVVRVAPNEVAFIDKVGLTKVYGHLSSAKKTPWYSVWDVPNASKGFFSSIDIKEHAFLRKRVSNAYSMSKILGLEPRIQIVADQLWEKLHDLAKSDNPIDMQKWASFFAFDVVTQLGVGQPIGFVEQATDIQCVIEAIHGFFYWAATLGYLPGQMDLITNPVSQFLLTFVPLKSTLSRQYFFKFLHNIVTTRMAEEDAGNPKNRTKDMLDVFISMKAPDGSPVPMPDVLIECGNLVGAGADTTAAGITTVMAQLLQHPEDYQRVQRDVDKAYAKNGLNTASSLTYLMAEKIPFLSACIKEATRLTPSIVWQLPRETPKDGVVIAGHYIPSGTTISSNPVSQNRLKEVFGEDADDWRPTRWLEGEDGSTAERIKEMDKHLFTFGYGSRTCIGRNLALVELHKFVGQFVRQFDAVLVEKDQPFKLRSQWFTVHDDMLARLKPRAVNNMNANNESGPEKDHGGDLDLPVPSMSSQRSPHDTNVLHNDIQASKYPSPRPSHASHPRSEFEKSYLPNLSLSSNFGWSTDAAIICEPQSEEYQVPHKEIAMQQGQPSNSQSTRRESANIEFSAKEHQQPSTLDTFNQGEQSLNMNGEYPGFSQSYDLIIDDLFDIPADMLLSNFAPPGNTSLASEETYVPQPTPLITSEMPYQSEVLTPTQELGLNRSIFQRLPTVLHESSTGLPNLSFNDADFDAFCTDITSRLGHDGGLHAFVSFKELQRFLMTYVDCFHRHLPLLHLPSISFGTTPSPLIISVCCIGALYRLDRKRARLLYELADRLLVINCKSGSRLAGNSAPTWSIQAKVIVSFYAFFGGSREIRVSAFNHIGWFTLQYRQVQNSLMDAFLPVVSGWTRWIERESKRRLLCAIYIISNLVVTTFGLTPGFVNSSDLQFEAPEEETLWNAQTEEDWRALSEAKIRKPCRTVRDIMANIASEPQEDAAGADFYGVPKFTILVIIHAVCIHMWLNFQFSQMLSTSGSSLPVYGTLRLALIQTTTSTLARCQKIISGDTKTTEHLSWDHAEGPLLFNCQALLRIAYTRQFSVVASFNRLTLQEDDLSIILSLVSAYASVEQERNQFIGHLLVRKSAALSWSLEHAVAGWDCALFLTKWVHTVECDSARIPLKEEEKHIFNQLKGHLQEMEVDVDPSKSLAATVAKAWSMFLSDVSFPFTAKWYTLLIVISGLGVVSNPTDGLHP